MFTVYCFHRAKSDNSSSKFDSSTRVSGKRKLHVAVASCAVKERPGVLSEEETGSGKKTKVGAETHRKTASSRTKKGKAVKRTRQSSKKVVGESSGEEKATGT